MQWGDTTLVKKFIQALLITFSLFVGMSRIFDFKHHWSDVVGGLLIGYIFSFITVIYSFILLNNVKKIALLELIFSIFLSSHI